MEKSSMNIRLNTLQFDRIDPQHSAPCITAIGYNGVQLWQKEGFVSANVLASSLEKAWLSLHVQETTAAFLTAALASGKQLASGTSGVASSEQVTPGPPVSTPLMDDHIPSSDAGQPLDSEATEDSNSCNDASKETDSKWVGVASTEPALSSRELDKSISEIETGNTSQDPMERGQNNPKVAYPVPENNLSFSDNHLGSSSEVFHEISNEANEVAHVNTEDTREVEKDDTPDSSAIKSNDIFLNIRLPDGSSLQVKFSVDDTLKMVKDYIYGNQSGSFGSFTLAIPYPRKVFNDQDLDSTLSKLGLFNRQALVVVPLNHNNLHYRGGSSHYEAYSSNDAGSSSEGGGYWGFLRRIISYANPFSYLSGGASGPSATQESQSGVWQYSPNPSLQNALRDRGRPSAINSSDMSGRNSNSNSNSSSSSIRRQQTSRSFGGNIHTLKHDDDDSRPQRQKCLLERKLYPIWRQ
ncbi:Plant UBX domain-containing protein 11 [Sesamum alatum]|uniref:Plant UBX domain-containing protein 11 n=1 Tax=Sesamum alatum TaxID=300844 RepID=A0AAE1YPG4_9LAMI|nr:Plant UBX domain-containing protein 11 [Sesamum alatum]